MASPASLPIYELRNDLIAALQLGPERRLIIEAPTGSGKSTQIPRMLLNEKLVAEGQEIVVLQPRRIAARMLARRVAWEQGGRLGDEVGYQVRFEKAVSAKTRIRFVTEGILLRELLTNPRLDGIGAIIFDEFHERHLYGDISLARALEVQRAGRSDLMLIVMSATLDTERLQTYLAPVRVLRSEGRTYPVEVRYLAPKGLKEEIWTHAARAASEAVRLSDGHLLIFMPGSYEIRKTIETIRHEKWSKGCDVLPLHGELSVADQDRALADSGRRKIIVATNVAETSLTIDGVTAVIDSGLARLAAYDSSRGLNTLTVKKISQASAAQRAGRAGRTAPGLCLRLWEAASHGLRPAQELPEVMRLDLAEVMLTLMASGVADIHSFSWLETPDPRSLERAENSLLSLGAIERSQTGQLSITELGSALVRYPLHPSQARMMEEAKRRGVIHSIALLVALMQGRPLFGKNGAAAPEKFVVGHEFSDFQPLLRAWAAARDVNFERAQCESLGVNGMAAREAGQLAAQLVALAQTGSGSADDEKPLDHETLGLVLIAGQADHLARRTSAGSQSADVVGGRRGQIPRESLIRRADLIVAGEIREIEGREVQVVLGLVTAIEEAWIAQMYPRDYQSLTEDVWDEKQRRVLRKERTVFRDLVLSENQRGEPSKENAARILAEKVKSGELILTAWDDAAEQWIIRLNRLAQWMPELELPVLKDEDRHFLIEQLCHGAVAYKDIKEKSPWSTLRSWLSPQQMHWLDQYAPERYTLPDGRTAKITYEATGEAWMSARIQQLYGLDDTPKIAAGRVPLVVHILAPSQRPLQVTKDLAGFWKNHYPKLKQELQRKYPKHLWK